jgi:uncharacterized protein YgiM (DUF1202 family)
MPLKWSFALILMFALALPAFGQEDSVSGTVYQTTNVRQGPDPRYAIVGQLSVDDRVQVSGREGEAGRWLYVVMPSGVQGWVPSFALILEGDTAALPVMPAPANPNTPTDADAPVMTTSYGLVNVRSGPGIEHEIVAQFDVGQIAEAIARNNAASDWLLVQTDDVEGWVAYFTVDVQGDPTELPILVPDSSGEALIPPAALLRTRFNARLRAQPDLSAPVTLTVPFNSEVTPIARSERSDWLYVGYEGAEGWGVTQLFDIPDDQLEALPVYPLEATPQATQAQ